MERFSYFSIFCVCIKLVLFLNCLVEFINKAMHTWGYFYEKAFNYSLTLFNVYGITRIFTFFLCQFWYLCFSRNIPFYVNFQVYGQKLIAFYPFNVCGVKSCSSYWCFLPSPFLSCTSPPLIFFFCPFYLVMHLLYRGNCFSQIFAFKVIYFVRFFICSMVNFCGVCSWSTFASRILFFLYSCSIL